MFLLEMRKIRMCSVNSKHSTFKSFRTQLKSNCKGPQTLTIDSKFRRALAAELTAFLTFFSGFFNLTFIATMLPFLYLPPLLVAFSQPLPWTPFTPSQLSNNYSVDLHYFMKS